MATRQPPDLHDRISRVALECGFTVESVTMDRRTIVMQYRHAVGPTVWDELSPSHISKKGKLNFALCHARCTLRERQEKKRLKKALRLAIPEANGRKLFCHYMDHKPKSQYNDQPTQTERS